MTTQLELPSRRTFHNAVIDSPRISKLVDLLKRQGDFGVTSLDISRICDTPRAASDVSEARACGFDIHAQYEGKSPAGRKIYRYRLKTL